MGPDMPMYMGQNNICLLSMGVKNIQCSHPRIRIYVQQTERWRYHESLCNGIAVYSMLFQARKSLAVQIVAETPLLIWKLSYSPAHHLQLLQPLDLLLKPLPSPQMRLDQALYLNHRPTSKTKQEQKRVKEHTREENKNHASDCSDSKCIFSWMQLNLTLESALILLLKAICIRQQGVVLNETVLVRAVHAKKSSFLYQLYLFYWHTGLASSNKVCSQRWGTAEQDNVCGCMADSCWALT